MSNRRPRQYVAPNKRPTIGLIAPGIETWYNHGVWVGADDTAREYGANLLVLLGSPLNGHQESLEQNSEAYGMADVSNVDGLVIIASTLGRLVNQETLEQFCKRYPPLPIVTIGGYLNNTPAVMSDNHQGIRELTHHLIDVHGYRRIAFIQGSQGTQDAQERYEAFVAALTERDIHLDPRLVVPGEFTASSGAAAIRLLVNARGLKPHVDFDAVFAANDVMASNALNVLQTWGLHIPHDIAVVGFDDSDEAFDSAAPLTTVRQPIREIGHQATEMLLTMLDGQDAPGHITIPTELVIRRSCGCLGAEVARAAIIAPPGKTIHSLELDLAAQYEQILAEMKAVVAHSEYTKALKQLSLKRTAQLLSAFCDVMLSDATPSLFIRELSETLGEVMAASGDPTIWQQVIGALRWRFLPYLDEKSWPKAENLWQQAQTAISKAAWQANVRRRLHEQRQSVSLNQVSAALSTACAPGELADILAQNLSGLGIASCYLSLYETVDSARTMAKLLLAYREEQRLQLEPGESMFSPHQLVPSNLLPRAQRYTMVVKSLHDYEGQLGLVALEVGPRARMTYYEALISQINSALRMALLYRKTAQARIIAEKADQLKTRLLANVSHELRTPLNVIQGYVQKLYNEVETEPAAGNISRNAEHIARSAQHLRRIIDDLLDLSRAEIGELDLHRELLDPHPLLENAFHDVTDSLVPNPRVTWRLQLPARLPGIEADPVRLNQVVLNLLSNALKFTEQGEIVLGASVTPPHLHIWVQDTGPGISPEQQQRIFEPFVTASDGPRRREGIGLGLSITRRLVALHQGLVTLDSQPGQGSTFHIYLPLPNLSNQPVVLPVLEQPVLLVISAQPDLPDEIADLGRREGIQIHRLQTMAQVSAMADDIHPIALAWDLESASRNDWMLIEQFKQHPKLRHLSFILYGREQGGAFAALGLASVIQKPVNERTLLAAIDRLRPTNIGNAILIVDDESSIRKLYEDLIRKSLPGYPVHLAADGNAAIATMTAHVPSLVILDLMMPGMDGFQVLEWMRSNEQTCQVPVLILTGRALTFQDVKRLEPYASVIMHSKDILSETELAASLHQTLCGTLTLPAHTGAVAKQALAYIHQHYQYALSLAQIADAVHVSERHLQRVFKHELGLSPWQYLNRYRVSRAVALLRHTDKNIGDIAAQTGFKSSTHFGRVFRKLNGLSPQAYREQIL